MTATETLPRSRELTFDGEYLARAWLSVALAASKDKERPALDHAVCVEVFPSGVRLVATDSYLLLWSWVGADGAWGEAAPGMDEAPDEVLVSLDPHSRAAGLMAFVLAQATAKDAPPVPATVTIGELDPDALTLDGLEGRAVVLQAKGETVRLRVHEGPWVDWRAVLGGFKPATTDAVALNPEMVGRLARLAKYHGAKPLVWRFGGADRMARVELADAEPKVEGAVMPLRVDLESTDEDRLRGAAESG